MFSWLFKKSGFGSLVVPGSAAAKAAEKAARPSSTQTSAAQAARAASAAAAAQTKAATKAEAEARRARDQAEAEAEWQPRLQAALAQAAQGDPSALLQVALATPVLEIKRNAVESLSDEPSLRQVEREFRRHDRRVHQIAKRRLEAAVLMRETQSSADTLLAQAESWRGLATLPVNHLVTLDRDWQALDAASIAPAQRERFEALRAALDAQVQAHAQHQQDAQRRNAQASQTLADLRLAVRAVFEPGLDDVGPSANAGGDAAASITDPAAPTASTALARLTALRQTAQALAAQEAEAQAQLPAPTPTEPAAASPVLSKQAAAHQALMQALAQSAQQAEAVEARLGWLAALPVAVGLAPQPIAASAAVAMPEAAHTPAPAPSDSQPAAVAAALPSVAAVEASTEASPPAVGSDPAAEAGTQPDTAAAVEEPLAASPAPTPADWAGRWQALPTVADAALAQRLDRQFAAWQQRNIPVRPVAASAPAAGIRSADSPPRRAAKAGPRPALDDAQRHQLAQLLDQADTALADGRLASLQQHLQALDQALAKVAELPASDTLHQRASALQAECQRLKDWQHWGGSRARDSLVTEAEALARAAGVPLPARKPGPGSAAAVHPAAQQETGQPAQGYAPNVSPTTSGEAAAADAQAPAEAPADMPLLGAVDQPGEPLADRLAEPAGAPQNQAGLSPEPAVATGEPAAAEPASQSEAQPEAQREAQPEAASQPLATAQPKALPAPKLDLKAHADAIASLRTRWRELDRLGGVAKPALWHRFDAALTAAHQPLAQRQAAQKAARQDNLRARQALLDALDALPDASGSAGMEGSAPAAAGTDLKESLRALDRFHTAWRQLGPVEHTVPSGSREALTQRWQRSVGRIEAPLLQARRGAQAQREQLIVRAQDLAAELARNPQHRDANQQVRALQADWQQQARAMPLARGIENALWGQFKAAIDGVFVQREAAWSARDAEQAALLAGRETLLASLQDLGREPAPDAKPVDLQRALADLDRAWRQGPELPRSAAGAAMEARYRDARAALQQTLADADRQRWQAQCDRLTARLTLCEQREQALAAGGDSSADELLAQGWAQLDAATEASGAPALPTDWAQALSARKQGSGPAALAGPLSAAAFDTLLLQLEAALELPASVEQQAARRLLKLQALKDSMEGRASADTSPAAQARWLSSALRQAGASPAQRQRLHKVLAALRQAGPGSLGVPAPRA